jgi:membrane protein implicated in regulation of membrane protease activity
MVLDSTARRRWIGAICVFAALVMLIGGETVLKGRLSDLAFLVYWLACFGFTGLSIAVAVLDARIVRHRLEEEQRKLLQTTLKKLESEVGEKLPENESRKRLSKGED